MYRARAAFAAAPLLIGAGPMMRAGEAAAERSQARALPTARWLEERVAVLWEDVTADQALAELSSRLGRPIWTSAEARRVAELAHVNLVANSLSGYQVTCVLCRIAGLDWTPVGGVIAVTASGRTPATWRMRGRALRSRVLHAHPDWALGYIGQATADVNMVDVTVPVAMARLSEAYAMNLWAPGDVRTSQELVTLQGRALAAQAALASLTKQLDVSTLEADGAIGLVPKKGANARRAATPPVASRATSVPEPVGRMSSDEWIIRKEGTTAAEGWAGDIRAVRRWRREHPGTGPSHSGDGRKGVSH